MAGEKNAVAVREYENNGGELITSQAFGMTIEQARQQINHTIDMYNLASEVIGRLLNKSDMYYMSTINNPSAKPKEGELSIINKQGVDKLLGFFRIETFPHEEKIDGGYKVTIIGKDKTGRYIATGTGICSRYEKKYQWIKADDEEYAAANENERRIVERKGSYGKYKISQVMTDERAIAHTLVSMATKRARAAFLRMALPGLNDVSFEGEGSDADYSYNKAEQTQSNTVMTDAEITKFKDGLKNRYSDTQIKDAMKQITNGKLKGMTQDQSLAMTTYLSDNFPEGNDNG